MVPIYLKSTTARSPFSLLFSFFSTLTVSLTWFNGFEDETCVGGVGGGEYRGGGVDVCVGRGVYGGGFEILFDLFNELTDIFPL